RPPASPPSFPTRRSSDLKTLMLEALDHGPYHRRTVYGNLAGLKGRTIRDVKITRSEQPIPEGPFLSTSNTTFPYVRDHLHTLFRSEEHTSELQSRENLVC